MSSEDSELRLGDFLEMVTQALEGVAGLRAPAAGVGLRVGRASVDVPVRVTLGKPGTDSEGRRVVVAVPGAEGGSRPGRLGRVRMTLGEGAGVTDEEVGT